MIEEAAISRRYWLAPRQLPTTVWNEYQTDVAAGLDSAVDWQAVTAAYDSIKSLNWLVDHYRATDQTVRMMV